MLGAGTSCHSSRWRTEREIAWSKSETGPCRAYGSSACRQRSSAPGVSQLLADFGAEVIEIEPPGGSALRSDAAWSFWGRGKKSIELDLKSRDDYEVARRIIEGSDVLIETFRQRVAETFNWFVRVISERFPGAFVSTPTVADGVPSGGLSFRLLRALTADGRWLQFSQTTEHLVRAFMRAVELDWMFDDPEWHTAPDFEDVERRRVYWEMLLKAVRSRRLAQWQEIFDADPNVRGKLYRHGHELLDHPQMFFDDWVVDVLDDEHGAMRQLAPMVKMSATPPTVGTAPGRNAHDASPETRLRAAEPDPGGAFPHGPPLEGVTIVELSSYYAAPFGATLLTDLGARVIKLEPVTRDPQRYMLPEFPEAAAIKALQGKQSVAVDLGTPEGR